MGHQCAAALVGVARAPGRLLEEEKKELGVVGGDNGRI